VNSLDLLPRQTTDTAQRPPPADRVTPAIYLSDGTLPAAAHSRTAMAAARYDLNFENAPVATVAKSSL